MPRGDGTGPGGMGPMTGRAAGYCAGLQTPGFANPIPGRGYGGGGRGGGGFGRGRRNQFFATGLPGWQRSGAGSPAYGGPIPYGPPRGNFYGPTVSKEQELDMLKGQAEQLEDALGSLKQRITELEAESKK